MSVQAYGTLSLRDSTNPIFRANQNAGLSTSNTTGNSATSERANAHDIYGKFDPNVMFKTPVKRKGQVISRYEEPYRFNTSYYKTYKDSGSSISTIESVIPHPTGMQRLKNTWEHQTSIASHPIYMGASSTTNTNMNSTTYTATFNTRTAEERSPHRYYFVTFAFRGWGYDNGNTTDNWVNSVFLDGASITNTNMTKLRTVDSAYNQAAIYYLKTPAHGNITIQIYFKGQMVGGGHVVLWRCENLTNFYTEQAYAQNSTDMSPNVYHSTSSNLYTEYWRNGNGDFAKAGFGLFVSATSNTNTTIRPPTYTSNWSTSYNPFGQDTGTSEYTASAVMNRYTGMVNDNYSTNTVTTISPDLCWISFICQPKTH